jgi:hypothetical protein
VLANQKGNQMTENAFDIATRTASRRGSLLAVGAAGLATALAGVAPAAAKKKNGNSAKKRCQARCQAQVGQCQTVVNIACAVNDNPEDCRQRILPCCESAGDCNAGKMLECAITGGVQP